MSDSRHINFQLMRNHILSLQDNETPRTGKKYWRSLEELADSPAFREFVAREFPEQADKWDDPAGRRNFLKLMGASLALAGLSGCVFQPAEKIVPYVKQPEEIVPGKPLFLRQQPRCLVQLHQFSLEVMKDAQQRSKAIRIIRTTNRVNSQKTT
jgi:MoCo/4Fe-4S cofactor protein with predicted Tat translocation signal